MLSRRASAALRFAPVRFGPMSTTAGSHPGCAATADVTRQDTSVRIAERTDRRLSMICIAASRSERNSAALSALPYTVLDGLRQRPDPGVQTSHITRQFSPTLGRRREGLDDELVATTTRRVRMEIGDCWSPEAPSLRIGYRCYRLSTRELSRCTFSAFSTATSREPPSTPWLPTHHRRHPAVLALVRRRAGAGVQDDRGLLQLRVPVLRAILLE